MQTSPVMAVLGVPPAYRRGLEAACRAAGWAFSEMVDDGAVVVTPLRRGDTCETVDRLVAGGHRVVALVTPFDRDEASHALHHGAAPADWDSPAEEIVEVALAVAGGAARLPLGLAARLCPATDVHRAGPVVTAEEAEWLRRLARGATVARLADDVGYSERAMFRRLADLYVRLGVTGRAEAIISAERHGLLAEPSG